MLPPYYDQSNKNTENWVLQWSNIYSLSGALITQSKFLSQILFCNFITPAATSAHIINLRSKYSHMCPWNLHVLSCPSQWLSGYIRFPENDNMTSIIFISPASHAHLQSLHTMVIVDRHDPWEWINAHNLTKLTDFEQYANISSTSGWGREINSS